MGRFIYHFKPTGMVGDTLIPLNLQKELWPSIYAEHSKKYEGREKLMERRLPILNCLWNDVLHFSPIRPQLILQSWQENGWVDSNRPTREVLHIPVERLNPEKTICFQSFNFEFGNHRPDLDRYWKFDLDRYVEQTTIAAEQIEVWRQDRAAGRRSFWFGHVMHLLALQEVDIRGCEISLC